MINASNYIEKAKGINFSQLPNNLQKGHEYVIEATENGTNWNAYNDEDIKRLMNAYFVKLNEHLEKSQPVQTEKIITPKTATTKHKPTTHTVKKEVAHKATFMQEDENDFEFVERIPDEIRYIKRYLGLHNKTKTKDDLLRFINSLQRSIIERKIRKTSPYAKQIGYIQDKLVETYNEQTRSFYVEIDDKKITEFKNIVTSEKVMPSVLLMKRYVNLNGKYGVKEKAKLLMEAMKRAVKLKKVTKKDKYIKIFDTMFANLEQYVKSKTQKILSIQQQELNGIHGALSACGCQHDEENNNELHGVEQTVTENKQENSGVVNSMDFKNVQFRTLGFTGKYRELIGDPSKGFTAMVFGKPKMGKSFLCVDFAGYLARNHGKVLYVAKEEGLDMTLQQKLNAKDVAHPNLFVAEDLPSDLNPYDFIFFDSVNKLGLSAQDLETLKRNYPDKSFIYIFQTTKEGNFKGANEFQHDVDIVIEVPQKGLAVQNGRFNQGGEMKIFEDYGLKNAA